MFNNRIYNRGMIIVVILIALLCTFCHRYSEKKLSPTYGKISLLAKPVMRFAVHPLHNPDKLSIVFGPLIQYLNARIPEVQFQLEASINYASFEEKLKHQLVEFALPNPYQTLMSVKYGYSIFAKMGDDDRFRGIILVRKDSKITTMAQLKNQSISYPAPTALAATMMPQYFLFKHGINILKETKSLYVGSQESSIMNVFLKKTVAGCTWPPPWQAFILEHPDKASALEVKWQTETLPNNGVVARRDISRDLVIKVRDILVKLHESEEGKKILANIDLSKFEVANEKTYQSVKIFLERFTKEVRAPESEK